MNTKINIKTIFKVLFSLACFPYFFMGAMDRPAAAVAASVAPAITETGVTDVTAQLKSLALTPPDTDGKTEERKDVAPSKRAPCEYPAILTPYVASLPKISDDEELPLPQQIVCFLCKFCPKIPLDGKDALEAKVASFITEEKPVKLLIVAFAVKSCNRGKVLAPVVDFGEYVALLTLDYMCRQIKSVYPPGAELLIFSREAQTSSANAVTQKAFGLDVFPEKLRALYQLQLRQLIHGAGFSTLKIAEFDTIEELYAKEEAREKELTKTPTPKGLKAFWRCDLDRDDFVNAAKTKAPRSYRRCLDTVADEVAHCLWIGSMATRRVVQKCVTDYASCIRLSVRDDGDGDVSSKLAINLVYDSDGTPPHDVLTFDQSGRVRLLSRKEIDRLEERGHEYQEKTYTVGNLKLAYMQWARFEPHFESNFF